jgi:YVTN family beta-propeller protein
MVYVIDLRTRNVAARVTGVGIDPYGLTVIEDAE